MTSRFRSALAAALVVLVAVTCTDSATGPRGNNLRVLVGFAPAFSKEAAAIFRNLESFQIEVDNVHVQLQHENGTIAVDTTVILSPGQDSVVLHLTVLLNSAQEELDALLELRDGDQVLFSGTQTILAKAGAPSSAAPPVDLEYTGPGALVTTMDVLPDTTMSATDNLVLRPDARDVNGQVVTDLALLWSVNDATVASVTTEGVLIPTGKRGAVVVTAELPTGISGSATINLIPPAASIAVLSGGGQTQEVGTTLTQPIVVETRAADGLPVAGAVVTFSVTSSGGSVSPTSAVTDVNGRAVAIYTLGNVPGPQGMTAAVGQLSVFVPATATSREPTTMVLEGSSSNSAVAGGALANPAAEILVTDAFGNAVPGVEVRLVLTRGEVTVFDATLTTNAAGRILLGALDRPTVAGTYIVTASNAALEGSPLVGELTITHAAAHHLTFVEQPTNSTGGAVIAPAITVEVRDEFENRVTTGAAATANVALALQGGAEGAALGGTSAQPAVAGVATFTVSVDKAATGYALNASSSSITGATSGAFNVSVGAPVDMQIVKGDGQGSMKGVALPDSIVVQLKDAGGNNVPGQTVVFTANEESGSLSPAAPSNVDGRAGHIWTVGTTGAQTVTATFGALTQRTFTAFIAQKLVITQPPSPNPQSGVGFVDKASVQLRDASNNPVPLAGISIYAARQGDLNLNVTSGDTVVATNAAGIATFTTLVLEGQVDIPFSMVFGRWLNPGVDEGIATATSGAITFLPGPASVIEAEFPGKYRRVPPGSISSFEVVVSDGYNELEGLEVAFTQPQGACSIMTPTDTSNLSGRATVEFSLSGAFTSCVILAALTSPPSGHNPADTVRIAIAPPGSVDGYRVWTGRVSQDWTDASNWVDGVPVQFGKAFIPKMFGPNATPKILADTSTGAFVMETGALFDLDGHELYVRDTVFADGEIRGPGIVAVGAVSTARIRGTIRALLEVGRTGCPGGEQYIVNGDLNVDALEIRCTLVVSDVIVNVAGNLKTAPPPEVGSGGQLSQTSGALINVGGDAIFDGYNSLLSGGVLDIKGNFFHTGDCSFRTFSASRPHVTRFSGNATSALRIHLNGCNDGVTEFGNVEIATTGAAGVELATNDEFISFDIADLIVAGGAKLLVTDKFSIEAGSQSETGVTVLDGGVLTNEGSIFVSGGNGGCTDGIVPQSIIVGPFSCLQLPPA